MGSIDIIMEEYKTLRTEVAQSLSSRLQIMSYGLTIIGVLIGSASFSTTKGFEQISALILTIAIPLISFLIISIWLSEAHRARRASLYLCGLEIKINKICKEKVLNWETGLRNGHKSLSLFKSHYYWTILFFILLATCSEFFGMIQLKQDIIVSALVSIVVFLIFIFPSMNKIKKLYDYDIVSEDWDK